MGERTTDRVAVAIATFNRPAGLGLLLESLTSSRQGVDFYVIVVDNDPGGSAGDAVTKWATSSGRNVRYLVEARPGIAAARNAAVAAAESFRYIAFVDDDETVCDGWLDEHLDALRTTDAVASHGSVVYTFPADVEVPEWIRRGGFHVNAGGADGRVLPFAATSNLVVDTARMPRGMRLRFDDQYGLTGGSDTRLTAEIVQRGGQIVWSARAGVKELVPAARCTPRWAVRRAFRTGNTAGRVKRQLATNPVKAVVELIVGSLWRMGGGTALTVAGLVLRRADLAGRGVMVSCRGAGMLASAVNVSLVEYARSET